MNSFQSPSAPSVVYTLNGGGENGNANANNSSSSNGDVDFDDDDDDDDGMPKLTYSPQNHPHSSYRQNNIFTSPKTYQQNTFIDWSREKLLIPHHNSLGKSISSHLNISEKWFTVLISAIVLGYITAALDLVSVLLNDAKKGLCFTTGENSQWSLLNPYSTCSSDGWYSWSRLLFGFTGIASNAFVNFPIYLLFAIVFVLIASYLTINREHSIRQSGIPEIRLIISGFNMNLATYLGLKTLLYKILGLTLVVSSGLWLGKEGPLVHVSCCIFNIIYEFVINFKTKGFTVNRANEAIRREILSAATATGISVAFNSPIGGVLFVLESMPSYFDPTKIMWISFVSATIAIIGLTGFNSFTDGKGNFLEQDLFQVNFGNFSWLFMEVVPFAILGFIGGVYGFLFINLNQKFQQRSIRQKVQMKLASLVKADVKWGPYLEILTILLITTILNFPLEICKLPMNAYLKLLFKECPKAKAVEGQSNATDFLCQASNGATLVKLLYIIIQGFFLTSYTFGVDLPGGVLMPSLVLGASTGRFMGILSQILQSKFKWDSFATCTEKSCVVSPSSYAVIGAASFMTGITKLTMSVVVIMFEMTGAVSYVLPIMCGVMTAKFVNDWLSPSNIYDTWLQNNFNQSGSTDFAGEVNEGKGTGLVSFSNLTTTIKSKLPDVTVKALMKPLSDVKCLCLINEEEQPYTAFSLLSFIQDDCHEGYPLIVNHNNPIYIGYTYKTELLKRLSTIDQRDSFQPISFQVDKLPKSALSMQLHYERKLANFIDLSLTVEPSILYTNDLSPAILILEEFEKLHLNHLVILDPDNTNDEIMSGFIDRFILARTINDKFGKLANGLNDFKTINEYNLQTTGRIEHYGEEQEGEDDDEFMMLRLQRKSIELIT
ncbi:GEF2 [Candida oxycetoniae]|uniref:GEF2 n=1 Tax=Candida oxycetoniae TaxID=497107 RepID=A0AAI9SU18_9ASCO|nr:GEF2 [Candida oxycetoniae]KAI3403061.2 GEF2 [Candida oxycetoniae]